jgi:hypothetical protein
MEVMVAVRKDAVYKWAGGWWFQEKGRYIRHVRLISFFDFAPLLFIPAC